ncbi:hypothetical protein AFK62_02720 [Cronobacter condimenti 1330]|uniref:DUF3592 domain-containing protein n=1 Tax=Cronobacter condimenti 1330 TaxID=1073999 RepID=A0ABM5VHM2_9ENTR|nr:hypothetical protein AFK62_02720 [Cronobacter condimenti 1330]
MEFLSYIMPKLAWIIPLVMLCFVIYVISGIRERNIYDAYIKENGVDVDAIMTEVTYDQYQRINNHLVAVLSLEYAYDGKKITSKRGVIFWVTDREKFVPGTPIRIRINPEKPADFYYLDYETC